MIERRYRAPEWETMSREDLRTAQLSLLTAQLGRIAQHNPFFADRWRQAGVDIDRIRSHDDFARMMPLVSKQDLLADQQAHPPFGTRLGVTQDRLNGLHMTSGTTGLGQEAYGLTAADQIVAGEGFAHAWTIAGAVPGDVVVITTPVTFMSAGLACVQSMAQAQLTPVYGFGVDKERLLDLISSLAATVIYALPTLLLQLREVAIDVGFDPRRDAPRLRGICTSLVTPPFSTVSELADFWGVPVYDLYGSTQASSAAAVSCEHGAADSERRYPTHFLEHNWLFEVVDPDSGLPVPPGEEGELVVTPLRREASPVVRFRIRDRVVHAPYDSCPCGRPFDGIVPGETSRYDDMVKVKGMNVWPSAVDEVVLVDPLVDEYRAVVRLLAGGREELVLRVAFRSDADLTADQRQAALAELAAGVKHHTLVTPVMEEVESLDHFDFKPKRWADERGVVPE